MQHSCDAVCQGIWGIQYDADDQVEADRAAAHKPIGPAAKVEGRIQSGTARLTEFYSFKSGRAIAAMLFLGQLAHDRHTQQLLEGLSTGRRSLLMLPFAGFLWDAARREEIQSTGTIGFGPIVGFGNGTTVRQAWYAGRLVALKRPDDPEDGHAAPLILHESSMMRCKQMKPLLGHATVGLVATGHICGSPFLATELMGPSAANVALLSPADEEAALERLKQLHDAGLLHGDPHPGNLLLPLSPVQPQQQQQRQPPSGVRWADFGTTSLCTDRQRQTSELTWCKKMLADLRSRRPWAASAKRHTIAKVQSNASAHRVMGCPTFHRRTNIYRCL